MLCFCFFCEFFYCPKCNKKNNCNDKELRASAFEIKDMPNVIKLCGVVGTGVFTDAQTVTVRFYVLLCICFKLRQVVTPVQCFFFFPFKILQRRNLFKQMRTRLIIKTKVLAPIIVL